MRYEQDGVAVWFGTPDAPAPAGEVEAASGTDRVLSTVTVGVQPPSASNSVVVTYRLNGGPPEPVAAALLTHDPNMKAQYFMARLPEFHVNDTVQYSVAAHLPGRQVPGPSQAGQLAASFRVIPDPPAEPAAARELEMERRSSDTAMRPLATGVRLSEPMPQLTPVFRPAGPVAIHPVTTGPVAVPPVTAGPVAVHPGGVAFPPGGVAGTPGGVAFPPGGMLVNGEPGAAGQGPGAPAQGPGPAEAGPVMRPMIPAMTTISLRRVPLAIDPLSTTVSHITESLLPLRTAAISRLYLGIDRLRQHMGVLQDVLAQRNLPAQLIAVLLLPDGTAGHRLQVSFDPASLGGTGPTVTVLSGETGCFHLPLPQGARVPFEGGVPLKVHGANGNATVTIPSAQIADNGLAGSVMLPTTLSPLPVSILAALTALVPVTPPATAPAQAADGRQLHVVKLGDEDSCQLSFGADQAVDSFPYGVFFRLVEPQTSIPNVASAIPAARGFLPIPSYATGALTPANAPGEVTYLDRVPVEQPLSVDGFRDRITGVTAAGTITADETVPMAGTLGIGYVLWMSQRWTFQGLGLGNLVYSLPLAPGEQQLIAIYERVDTATVQESEFFTEEETEVQSARADTSTHATFNSAFNEAVNGGSSFSTQANSSSWAAGGGFSIGIFSAGGGGGGGSTSASGSSSQWLQGQRDTTQQAAQTTHSAAENQAAARRSAMHTSMSMASASESESATTKVITNHNHTRALTLQYWEVQRLYDVATAIDGLTLTCLVPMQVVRFLPAGQPLTLADTGWVASRGGVMNRYASVIKHADVLARTLPRRFQYGLSLLQQFAADPTAEVEPFGGAAEDVLSITLTGSFVPSEDVYVAAVTKRNTRIGPVRLTNTATIPADTFASRDELIAYLTSVRQGPPVSLSGSLALPPDLNRSDVVGFEFRRAFRPVSYVLLSPELATLRTFTAIFPDSAKPSAEGLLQAAGLATQAMARATVRLTPGDQESGLGGPLLNHFQAAIQEASLNGGPQPPSRGETYANESLNGVELPAQPYPVPAVQVGPVLRYNQILEIEKMAQHVVSNTILYSRALWSSMSPDERAILLEPYTIGVPADGIADQSQMVPLLNCVENRVLGFFGNSMIMPFMIPQAVAEQMNIDPAQLQSSLLAFQQQGFTPPHSTIALPTPGVLGEAVLGHCQSAEKIDLTRFWNWADAPADTAPGIAPVSLPTSTPSIAGSLTAPNALTNLPPLINNVLTPPTPDTALLQALSKSAASQQDFSPDFTGAKELASLVTTAQKTAESARSEALTANTKLVGQAMDSATKLITTGINAATGQAQQAQKQGQGQGQQGQGQGQQGQGQGQKPGQGQQQKPGQGKGTTTGKQGQPTGTQSQTGTQPPAGGSSTGTPIADASSGDGLAAGAGDIGSGSVLGDFTTGAGAADLGAAGGAADAGLAADAGDAAILLA
jgi:hypothetical protein